MKVSELTGAKLDLAVARHDPMCSMLTWENRGDHWAGVADIEGTPTVCCFIRESNVLRMLWLKMLYDAPEYSPSRNWSDGGPIIEQANIQLTPPTSPVHRNGGPQSGWGESGVWSAVIWERGADGHRPWAYHETSPLIAAMRCYVASKFGEEVPY